MITSRTQTDVRGAGQIVQAHSEVRLLGLIAQSSLRDCRWLHFYKVITKELDIENISSSIIETTPSKSLQLPNQQNEKDICCKRKWKSSKLESDRVDYRKSCQTTTASLCQQMNVLAYAPLSQVIHFNQRSGLNYSFIQFFSCKMWMFFLFIFISSIRMIMNNEQPIFHETQKN